MAKWNEYGLKTGTSARDEVLILDSDTNTNKRITVGDIQEFANGKMLEKENTTLNTEAKTLIGAINEVDAKNDAQDASLEEIEKKFSSYVKKTDVDSTLSVSGSPADAKAVGDALKKDKGAIEELADKKITKFYASSQGNTHLPDSDKGKIQDMLLYGKSEQAQYKGKNLLNCDATSGSQYGVTRTKNLDGTYTLNGTSTDTIYWKLGTAKVEKGKQYKLVGWDKNAPYLKGACGMYVAEKTNKFDDGGNGIIYDSTMEEAVVKIVIAANRTFNNTLIKPMITNDLSATYDDFEPYVGGIPSPNPDYPQEIKAVVNPKVVVRGKNLINLEWLELGSNNNGIDNSVDTRIRTKSGRNLTMKKGEKYIFSANKMKMVSFISYDANGVYCYGLVEDEEWHAMPYIMTARNDGQVKIVYAIDKTTTIDISDIGNIQVEAGETATPYEPYTEQSITLPYTLYAIPVSTGGNVTIGGQQYVADYVDVERGKLVRMCKEIDFAKLTPTTYSNPLVISREARYAYKDKNIGAKPLGNKATYGTGAGYITNARFIGMATWNNDVIGIAAHGQGDGYHISIRIPLNVDAREYFTSIGGCKGLFQIDTPEEIDLTPEQIQAFKSLSTNYPVTNIDVSSEQLDGYTVFDYPISMAEGWNYVKQQIGDTRDYIYDMDLQSAEAYVNSEYAVALTELEVM